MVITTPPSEDLKMSGVTENRPSKRPRSDRCPYESLGGYQQRIRNTSSERIRCEKLFGLAGFRGVTQRQRLLARVCEVGKSTIRGGISGALMRRRSGNISTLPN